MRPSLFLLLLLALPVYSDIIQTETHTIRIDRLCPEGYVICDWVSYRSRDLAANTVTELMGTTVHALCADGVSPCRFLGYRFRDQDVNIMIYEHDDTVDVEVKNTANNEILSKQQGRWVSHVANNECHASSTVTLDMAPGQTKHDHRHWLVGQFDGQPCRESSLSLSVIDADSKQVLFSTGHSFYELTRHDDYTDDQLQQVAYEKLHFYLNDATETIDWPDYLFFQHR